MRAREVIALGAIGAVTFVGAGRLTSLVLEPAPSFGTIPPATTSVGPVCSLLADGADSPNADAQWAALSARYGPLDYVGGYSYGTVVTTDGTVIGFALAEDSDIWSDPSCLTFTTPERGES